MYVLLAYVRVRVCLSCTCEHMIAPRDRIKISPPRIHGWETLTLLVCSLFRFTLTLDTFSLSLPPSSFQHSFSHYDRESSPLGLYSRSDASLSLSLSRSAINVRAFRIKGIFLKSARKSPMIIARNIPPRSFERAEGQGGRGECYIVIPETNVGTDKIPVPSPVRGTVW